ncbi:hypothetical protein QWY85_15645 [Neolewinella lacunae]|uniref:Transposase n=1 Tax=Neolewinella lacunae TaxID=1517758 RepID=A0A923PHP8_9BACT|nr:hypothetical protein [Neolewinella lacunae]MBC6992810.1 hypothetical protein [Neolewinella lacunae]MDN3636101.1 hypothetical protein [Neolewinella lacunae]
MALSDKYINPLTDFGFKKLFGEEVNEKERELYEDSLKYYRDLKNVVDTAFEEGEVKGKIESKTEIAKGMKADGVPNEKIAQYTGLSTEEIENL